MTLKSDMLVYELTHSALQELGVRPNKSLGQNFLVSEKIRSQIIEFLDPKKGDRIIEIGGGLGALTFPIARSGANLSVYEIDRTFNRWLRNELTPLSDSFDMHGDFLENYPLENLEDRNFKIIGNLPYQITSPILERIYDSPVLPSEIIIMVQKEVADRIAAPSGTKTRGRLTLWCEYHATVESSFDAPSDAFYPAPKVGSCVLRMKTRSSFPLEKDKKTKFFKFVKIAFAMKRKTLVNNVAAWNLKLSKDDIRKVLESYGFDVKLRAEDLSLEDFLKLFNSLALIP